MKGRKLPATALLLFIVLCTDRSIAFVHLTPQNYEYHSRLVKYDSHDAQNIIFQSLSRHRLTSTALSTTQRPALSTNELLEELNRQDIRYPPTASRQALEALLAETQSIPKASGEISPMDLTAVVKELMALGVRLPPNASRQELERLLRETRKNPVKYTADSSGTSTSSRRRQRMMARLLNELDDLGIPYPPEASPATLQRLLQTYNYNEVATDPTPIPTNSKERKPRPHKTNVGTSNRDKVARNSNRTTAELLIELNSRGIKFPPTATRQDLEHLLLQYKNSSPHADSKIQEEKREQVSFDTSKMAVLEDEIVHKTQKRVSGKSAKETGDNFDHRKIYTGRPHRPKRKMESNRSLFSKLYGASKKTVKYGVYQTVGGATSGLSRVAELAARQAKYVKRTAGDFFAEDENGVRNVAYEYVSKDVLIDVPAESVIIEETRPPRKQQYTEATVSEEKRSPRTRPFTNSDEQSKRRSPQRRKKKTPASPSMFRSSQVSSLITPKLQAPAQGEKLKLATQSSLFRLPPAISRINSAQKGSAPRSKKKRSDSRRIYSPYDVDDLPSSVYRDSIDRLGEFIAKTTDTILWGSEDEEKQDDETVRTSRSRSKRQNQTKSTTSGKKYHKRRWRDSLEEWLDSMLGIHENGKYYNRWAKDEDEEASLEEGADALAYASGRAPSQSRKRRAERRTKKYDKPFWELESTLASLFGKSPPRGYNKVARSNLLPVIKIVIKSFVTFCGSACEWATVRGSLPQPVVVVGVTSCVVSVRPGRRVLAMVVSLLAFRLFGELIHEGLYGDEDWDEHDEESRVD